MQSRSQIKVSLCLGFIALTGMTAQSARAGGAIVISQLFGGGGQTAAGPNGDFIELFNRSCVAVNLDGYSVQVASGGGGTVWNPIQLPNFQLDPGKYYCIRLTTTTTGTAFAHDQLQGGLPAGGDLMLSSSGKAAIVVGNAALPAGTCPASASVVDFVKYEGASTACTEGGTVGAALSGTGRCPSRRPDVNGDGVGDGCQDSDVNSADFMVDLDPCVPRNNSTPANLCPGAPVFGGCSLETGACIVTPNAASCAAQGGNYLGDCTPCVAPQACCIPTPPTVTCVVESELECEIDGGIFNSGQFACPPIPACPPLGRCCSPDGTCVQTFQSFCVDPDVYGGNGTTCAGTPCQGRCCDINGECTLTGEINCVAPSVFAGIGTTCAGTPCQGRCCSPNGDCAMTSELNCTAPNVFAGLGTACGDGSACVGACCSFNGGECTTQGSANCNAPDVFAGLGSTCALVQCSGRCCQAGGACSVTSPGQCVGGVFSIGQTCDPVQIFQFNNVNMFMVDNPVQTPASNVQAIESPSPILITDLDVDLNADHMWPGDVQLTLEHLGTSVIIYDRPGVPTSTFGCATDDFSIILDDEGAGGPIEGICNLTEPSALSPPNYTPANPLDAFDGMDAVGDWTITSIDFFNGDNGTLLSWSLHVGFNGQACPTTSCTCFGDMNGDAVVNGKDVKAFAQCVAAGGAGCPCGDMNHAGGATSADVPSFVTACLTGTCGAP